MHLQASLPAAAVDAGECIANGTAASLDRPFYRLQLAREPQARAARPAAAAPTPRCGAGPKVDLGV